MLFVTFVSKARGAEHCSLRRGRPFATGVGCKPLRDGEQQLLGWADKAAFLRRQNLPHKARVLLQSCLNRAFIGLFIVTNDRMPSRSKRLAGGEGRRSSCYLSGGSRGGRSRRGRSRRRRWS